MPKSRDHLRRQFRRAVREGWLPAFTAAAERYQVRPEVLMGIASRETDMGGPQLPDGRYQWLVQPGDGGHGYGLLQVDHRSFPDWVTTGAWQSAGAGIFQGAAILASKRDGLLRRVGQVIAVKDRRTGLVHRFTMPIFEGAMLERVTIASYNAGDWAPYHVLKRNDPDAGTTRKNYSADVIDRAAVFAALMQDRDAGAVSPPG